MGDPVFIVILVLLVGVMWFMSNRSRKQQLKQQEFRNNLKPGDEVMTGSGLFGTVVSVDDDTVTLESTPGSQSRWLKAAIAKLIEAPAALADVDGDDEEADDEEYDDDDADYDYDDADDDYDDADDEDLGDVEVPDDLSGLDEAKKPEDPKDTQ